MSKSQGVCEMCGHFVAVRQKAHIFDGRNDLPDNLLMLCPSCHVMLDTHLKPKLFHALNGAGIQLPSAWSKSIYDRAAEASAEALRRKGRTKK
jgi:hypothetical protein